jgi:hypothetical protein
MIYDQIEIVAAAEINLHQPRLDEIEALLAEKTEAVRSEDSKRREAALVEEIKALRREQRQLWGTIEGIKAETFRKLLAVEYDLPITHPKFDRVYSLAYQHGHGSGYSDVENYFSEFVDLVKD